MGKVYNINNKKEMKLDGPSPDFNVRLNDCVKKEILTGKPCDCSICTFKYELVESLIYDLTSICMERMKQTGEVWYEPDVYHILSLATDEAYRRLKR